VALLKAAQIVQAISVVDVVACSTNGGISPETRRLLAVAAGIAMSGFLSWASIRALIICAFTSTTLVFMIINILVFFVILVFFIVLYEYSGLRDMFSSLHRSE
jgi:hypothetical protein